MNENWTKFIELFLQGELSTEDTAKLQAELDRNPEMRKSLEQQKLIHEAAKRSGERQLVKTVQKSYRIQRNVKTSIISVLAATAIATLSYFAYQALENKRNSQTEGSEAVVEGKYQELDKHAELDNLPIAYFEHDGKDATYLSPKGILLSVPEKTFELNGKPYDGKAIIQFQEAIDASDIIKAGLSTMADNRLLETQGMFQLKAFTPDGKRLTVNEKEGIYLQIPVDENKKGMMLFDGVKTANGNIDWQNPKPIEKLPVQANMLDLDLFPPGYEAKLDDLKWQKAKKQRDSLYLSFEERQEEALLFINDEQATSTTPMPILKIKNTELTGENLFYIECAMCHDLNKNSTGPDLYQVRRKWQKANQGKGVYDWVNNWQNVANKSEFAKKVSEWSPVAHRDNPELDFKQIASIYNFIDSNEPGDTIPQDYGVSEMADALQTNLLPPSKVLAIWKEKFNGTILATRDFEKRMKAIHEACNEKIFDVYVNSLNKPLWQIDEQCVNMGYPNFQAFADERVGALKQDNAHMNILRQFYESNVSRLKDLAKKDKNFQKSLEMEFDNKVKKERKQEAKRTIEREQKVFKDEYELNLKNVLKQMGPTVGVAIHGGGTVYNIDKYMMDATIARKSATISDPITGKTGEITYNPMKATIANAKDFGKLFMYLMPHELTSFQRINPSNGKFDYSLNDAIKYDAVFVGINDNGYFISDSKNLKGGNLGEIQLKSVSEKEFEHTMEKLSKDRQKTSSKSQDMGNELNWLKLEKENYVEQKLRQKHAEFRRIIGSIIYPCASERANSTSINVDNPFL
ncbi:MAG: c-type cytochrome [Bacteroidota bacterium]